jgi:hypothetical protein
MKLTEEKVRELLEIKKAKDRLVKQLKAEYSLRQLALKYGVHEQTIAAVWKKKIWKEIQ